MNTEYNQNQHFCLIAAIFEKIPTLLSTIPICDERFRKKYQKRATNNVFKILLVSLLLAIFYVNYFNRDYLARKIIRALLKS